MSTINKRRSNKAARQAGDKERFWRQLVREWRSSGQSVRDFCDQRQISEPSFYFWRRTITQRDGQKACFVPVQVVADAEPAAATSGHQLELVLGGGRVLRIGPGFDGPALQRLLALLAEGRP